MFYAAHSSESYYDNMVDFITTDAILVMDLVGEDAVRRWQAMCGPVSRNEALDVAPDSLRARFGHNDIANAVHASDRSVVVWCGVKCGVKCGVMRDVLHSVMRSVMRSVMHNVVRSVMRDVTGLYTVTSFLLLFVGHLGCQPRAQ